MLLDKYTVYRKHVDSEEGLLQKSEGANGDTYYRDCPSLVVVVDKMMTFA